MIQGRYKVGMKLRRIDESHYRWFEQHGVPVGGVVTLHCVEKHEVWFRSLDGREAPICCSLPEKAFEIVWPWYVRLFRALCFWRKETA